MNFEAQWMSARLNYEILNIPMQSIATMMSLRLIDVEDEAEENGWKQWFPDDSPSEFDPNSEANEGENLLEIKANQYTSEGKKRLEVYAVAKQLMLMSLYTKLEINLIQKATEAAEDLNASNISDIGTLSGVLNSLTKDLTKLAQSMTLGQDDKGLPQLIIRDLSGAAK